MTVGQLLASASGRELAEWQAFYALEPFGEVRADLRAGIVAATVANVQRDPDQEPYSVADFLPRFDDEAEQPMDVDELWAKVDTTMMMLAALTADNGTDEVTE